MKRSTILNRLKGYRGTENMQSDAGNDVPNQNITYFNNATLFESYGSIIAIKYKDKVYLGKHWDYSKTTGKYRNKFLNETKKETEQKLESGEYKLLK